MADNNTENLQNLDKLFTAVDTIIQKRIENLPYDKTITATIVDDSTAKEGRYIVDDGTTTFDAYTENENYHNNEQVYVNIPLGDYNKQRLIMGKYIPNDGNKYVYKYVSPMNSFIDITGNLIDVTETSQWGLIANKTTDRTCYYKRIWAGEVDLQGYDVLGFSGRFRTWLPEYRDLVSGEYGIQIDILGSRPTTEGENQEFYYTFYFSNKDMYGDPYNFDAFYLQEKTFDISGISKIDAIAIGLYQDADFRTENSFIPVAESDNIFVSNPMLAIGYSSDRFKTDEAIIYTDNPLTYLSLPNAAVKRANPDTNFDDAAAAQAALDEANKRLLQLRWIHLITEEEEGVYNLSEAGISASKAICIDKPEELPESAAIKWYKYNKPKVDEKLSKTYSAAAGEFWDDISFTNSDLGMVVIPDSKEPKEEYKAIVEYPSEEYVKELTEIELNKTNGLYDERRALFNFTNELLNKLYYKQGADNIEAFITALRALIAAYKDTNDISKTSEELITALQRFSTLLSDFINTYLYSDIDSIFIARNQSQILDELFERYNLDNKLNDDNFAGLVLILYDFILNPTAHLYLNNVLESISYIKENVSFDTDEELNKQIELVILPLSLLILHLLTLRLFLPSTVSSFFSNIWTAANGVLVGASSYATVFGNALKDFNDAYAAGTLISSAPVEEAAILTEALTIITKLLDLDNEIARYRSTELGKVNYYTSNIITFENEDPDAELNKVKELLAELRIDIDVDGYLGTYNCYGETGEILNENESLVSRLLEAKIVKGETITDAVGPDDFVTWEFPLINSMIERPVDVLEYVIYETATDAAEENFKNGDYYYLNEEKQYIHIVPTDEVVFLTTPNYYYKKNNVSIDDSLPDVFSITRKGDSKLYFRIKQMYSSNYTNNAIKCYVKKADGSEFTAVANLSFGEKGNSGTDYTFYLEFEDKTKFALLATGFTEDEVAEDKHKIKIVPRLFNYNGREITNEISRFDFIKNCDPNNEITMINHEGKYVEIYSNKAGTEEWNPANFANTIIEATCSIEMTLPLEEGFLLVEEIPESEAYGNIKHTLVNKSVSKEVSITLLTALPIPIIKDNKTVVAFDGSSSISYSSSGTNPSYYKDLFTLYSLNENRIEYTSNLHWKIYNIDGEETDLYYPTIDAERRLTVPGMYLMDGENVSLFADVDRPGEEENSIITTTEFILPLRIFMRVYDSKLLNSWDGSLTLDSQNGIILSALMGAGYKDERNTFNGVLMGSTGVAYDDSVNNPENDSYYSGLGLYGYSEGLKSFGFNINGRAFLGKAGKGLILFDGNSGTIASLGALDINNIESGTHINLDTGLFYSVRGLNKIIIDPNDENLIFEILCSYNDSASTLMSVGADNYYLKSADNNLNFNLLDGELTANKFSLSASNGTRSLYLSSVDSSSPFKVWKKNATWPTVAYNKTITGDGYPFSIDWDGNLYVNNITIGNKIKTRYFYQLDGQIKSTETTIMGFGENSTLEYSNANTVTIYQRDGEYPGIVIGDNGPKALYLYNNKIELPVNSYIYAPLDWWNDGLGGIACTIDKLIGVSSKKNIVIGDAGTPADDRDWNVNIYGSTLHFNGSAVSVSSDRRLKTNFSEINNYKNFIMSLHPKKYAFKKHKELFHLGFIADEVFNSLSLLSLDDYGLYEKVSLNEDDSVDENNPNTYYECLAYDEFIAPHIALTQEHENEINKLKDKISILEDKIESLLKYIKESKED